MGGKTSKGEGGAPAWMATFADMMSLLLTFFVLLLSFAEMDIVKFRDAMGSINQALGFMPSGRGMFQHTSSPAPFEDPMATSVSKSANDEIMEALKELIAKNGLKEDVEVEDSDRGVILRVRGRMFFNAGSADLKYESQPVLEKIADLMKKFPSKVSIEGHTDNIPMSAGKYSSNWEISTARAYAALRFLQERGKIDAARINIAGFGDTHPLAPNDIPEGRNKNRRVEFVFYEQ
jgi:chemotaxis protein MotB